MNKYLKYRVLGKKLLHVAIMVILSRTTGTFGSEIPVRVKLEALALESGPTESTLSGGKLYVVPNSSAILKQLMMNETPEIDIHLGNDISFNLDIEENDLIAETFIYREIDHTNDLLKDPINVRTFRGSIQGEEESHVRLTISDDFLSGMIRTNDSDVRYVECLGITPEDELLISIQDDIPRFDAHMQAVQDYAPSPYHESDKMMHDPADTFSDSTIYTAEIGLVADFEAFQKTGTASKLAAELISILNMTDAYYEKLGINYKLVEMIIFTDARAGDWPVTTNAGEYLRAFDLWVAGGGVQNWHDIATFWTGREIGYSYAWLGTVGQYGRHHLVEFWGLGETRWLANFQAHESGHNWGAEHVAHDSRYIMSPYIYSSDLSWNDTTSQNFSTYLQRSLNYLSPGIEENGPVFFFSQPEISLDDNQNGRADPGEEVTLELTIKNVGDLTSTSGAVVLTSKDSSNNYFEIKTPSADIPPLAAGDSVSIEHVITISNDDVASSWVDLSYVVEDIGQLAIHNFKFGIGLKADYQVQLSGVDFSGNSDGKFQPGESVAMILDLENVGEISGENISINVGLDSISNVYVDNLDTLITIPDISALNSEKINLAMDISQDFPRGHEMNVQIQIRDSEAIVSYKKSFMIGLPDGYAYWENFEYDRPGSSTSGWYIQNSGSSQELVSLDSMEVYDKVTNHWVSTPFEGDRALSLGSHWIGSYRVTSPQISLEDLRRPELSFQEIRAWDQTRSGGTPEHGIRLQYAYDPEGPWHTLKNITVDESEIGIWRSEANIDLEEIGKKATYLSFSSDQQHYYWRLDKITIKDGALIDPIMPEGYSVYSYPNPFNSTATILYDLEKRSNVRIELFNIRGQLVEVLAEESKPAGTYSLQLNAYGYDSGMYLCRLQAADNYYVTKMILMK